MFHRAATLLIILFWLTMTGLLVRNELTPEGSRMREVPVGHVLKLLFLHSQPSNVHISTETAPVGHLHLLPRIDETTALRVLDFSGSVQLRAGTPVRQRLEWDGLLYLDRTLGFRQLAFRFKLGEPTPLHGTIEVDAERAHVALRTNAMTLSERDYTLDEKGARELLGELGVDPAMLAALRGAKSELQPALHARQSSLLLHGERVETYLLALEQSGQTLAEFHLSQLGQLLHARTAFGYTLAVDDFTP